MKKISKGIKISMFFMFTPITLFAVLVLTKTVLPVFPIRADLSLRSPLQMYSLDILRESIWFCLGFLFLGIVILIKLHLSVRTILREMRRDIENTLQNLFKGAL